MLVKTRRLVATAIVACTAIAPAVVASAAEAGARAVRAKPAPKFAPAGERQGLRPSSRRSAQRPRASASHITTNQFAYCRRGEPYMNIQAHTPSGVPVLNTTAGIDRQRLWWRAHMYQNGSYKASSVWFYTDLSESTRPRSSAYWINATTGVNNAWYTPFQTFPNFGNQISVELQWDQGGARVHRDTELLRSKNADYLSGDRYVNDACHMPFDWWLPS